MSCRIARLFPSLKTPFVACLIVGLSSSPLASERPPTTSARGYELIDLGTLGGQSSSATAVDELGSAAGWASTAAGERRAFVWDDALGMQDLGTLQNGTFSSAMDLSGDGEWVVGNSGIRPLQDPQQFMDITQGFVRKDEAMQSVGALYNPATYNRRFGTSEARGVNDRGQVVGFSIVLRQNLQSAFLWADGVMTDIGHANDTASNTRAFDINDNGQVVGDIVASGEGSAQLAFIWQDGELQTLETAEGYASSTAVSINERGEVVGWSADGSVTSAVVWSSGAVENIGTLPGDESSQALGINDLGQVVGWSGAADETRAFIWQAGVMTDLNSLLPPSSDWVLVEATDINGQGLIVGSGRKDGQLRAFMLRPRSERARENGLRALSCLRPANP